MMMRVALLAAGLIAGLQVGPAYAGVVSPTVTIAVNHTTPTPGGVVLPARHVVTPFDEISISATVTTPDGSIGTTGDLYIGARFPDGRFASWVDVNASTVVIGPVPVPLGRETAFAGVRTLTVTRAFDRSEPGGSYLFFAILVRPGKSPLDAQQWIDAAVWAMFFDRRDACFSGIADCAFPPPEDYADAIVIFVPDGDFPGITGANELPIPGRVLSVERGSAAPGAPVILTANTFIASMRGGVPRRIGLARFPNRAAFYPIFIGEELSAATVASDP